MGDALSEKILKVLDGVAQKSADCFCRYWIYQEEVPEQLREESEN